MEQRLKTINLSRQKFMAHGEKIISLLATQRSFSRPRSQQALACSRHDRHVTVTLGEPSSTRSLSCSSLCALHKLLQLIACKAATIEPLDFCYI